MYQYGKHNLQSWSYMCVCMCMHTFRIRSCAYYAWLNGAIVRNCNWHYRHLSIDVRCQNFRRVESKSTSNRPCCRRHSVRFNRHRKHVDSSFDFMFDGVWSPLSLFVWPKKKNTLLRVKKERSKKSVRRYNILYFHAAQYIFFIYNTRRPKNRSFFTPLLILKWYQCLK